MITKVVRIVRDQFRRPVGINGWISFTLTLLCVAIILAEGNVSVRPIATWYFTALHFARGLLGISFLYALMAVIFGKGKNQLIPATAVLLAVVLTSAELALSLMFLPMLILSGF